MDWVLRTLPLQVDKHGTDVTNFNGVIRDVLDDWTISEMQGYYFTLQADWLD